MTLLLYVFKSFEIWWSIVYCIVEMVEAWAEIVLDINQLIPVQGQNMSQTSHLNCIILIQWVLLCYWISTFCSKLVVCNLA